MLLAFMIISLFTDNNVEKFEKVSTKLYYETEGVITYPTFEHGKVS
jgi:hypothetical protein